MAYRRKYKGRKSSYVRKRPNPDSERIPMLNLNRVSTFRYAIRDIMTAHEIDEAIASTVVASVIAKGSRISIAAAREYVIDQENAGSYPANVTDDILDLLDRYSKYR